MNGYKRRSRRCNRRDSNHGIKKAAETGLLCAFVELCATVFRDLHSAQKPSSISIFFLCIFLIFLKTISSERGCLPCQVIRHKWRIRQQSVGVSRKATVSILLPVKGARGVNLPANYYTWLLGCSRSRDVCSNGLQPNPNPILIGLITQWGSGLERSTRYWW